MAASATRHETRALLRAHLAAAAGQGHLTRRCGVCHRLQRLAMEPASGPDSHPDAYPGTRSDDRSDTPSRTDTDTEE
ncbi:DUF6274 family protein [Streptomyces liangshanensis]|uniref:DUF6274 family protein n=1 Tax=Streptomyces liangshanensis TaxID=2717324 RepID=UPI0036D95189